MNFSKEYNVFGDIPGFDASKGERIVKALQKLWKKIEYLEQIRISEKKGRSEEIQTNSKDEDLTITDVQYKLLVLQLQYIRSLLRKKLDKDSTVSKSKISENYQLPDGDNVRTNECSNDIENKTISQATQTVKNVAVESNPSIDSGTSTYESKASSQMLADCQSLKSERPFEYSTLVTNKMARSKPHYHLKLDDVPFILGASSNASHSVVANVQNIISMMKSHNKALCGPKPVSRPSSMAIHIPEENNQDATKMLNKLSQDLCELALKQQKLVKSIDAAQGNNRALNITKKTEKDDKKQAANLDVKRIRSNSESGSKLHADVKNFSKRKDFVKSKVYQQKSTLSIKDQPSKQKSTLSVKHQPSNLSIMDRRKLLRSLQNFKSHLSEEDISWN